MADILFDTTGQSITTQGYRDEYAQFFRLVLPDDSDGYTINISEPIGWDASPEEIDRSERWHGFNYEILGEGKLKFENDNGRGDIVSVFNQYGFDAQIKLQHGTTYEGGEVIEYEGILDLFTKSDDGTFFSCTVKKATLHDKVEPRFDTKLDLYATADLDGGSINAITPTSILLHSKALQEKFLSEFDDNTRNVQGFFKNDTDIFILPECSNPSLDEIKTFDAKTFSAMEENPTSKNFWIWEAFSSGNYRFQIAWSFTGLVTLVPRTLDGAMGRVPFVTSRQVRSFLVVERNKVLTYYEIGQRSFAGTIGSSGFSFTFSGTLDSTIFIQRDDKVYIYSEVKYTYRGVPEIKQTNYSITNTNTRIQVDGSSENDQSGVSGLTLFNALKRAVHQIAGRDCLESTFFNTGCGKNYMITNGFSIRRFANKNPVVSFKDLLESIDAIFFVGYEYNTSTSGQKIVIRKAEDFYSGGEIVAFDEIHDYQTEVASQYIYSSLEIGYSKFLEEGVSYLDEHNTKHEYQLQIEGHENRMSSLSSLIASGYAIETTRREQFADSPKDSTRYDDDIFIIAYRPSSSQTDTITVDFVRAVGFSAIIIQLADLPPFFANGTKVTVTGTQDNNRDYTITQIDIITNPDTNLTYYRAFVAEACNNESAVSATFTTVNLAGRSEKNEPFASVTGIISPSTAYNLRISPKRMLYNRAKWVLSSLFYKSSSSVIKNTFFKMNGELSTQYNSDETCVIGDVNKDVVVEKANRTKGNLGAGLSLFRPEWVSYSTYTTRAEWNDIRKALRGALGGGKDYGYFTITTPDGTQVSGYPFKISRQSNSGKTVVKMLRKD